MNSQQKFSIRRSFLFPLGLLLVLTGALLVLCVVRGEPTAKILILGFIMLPVVILFVESVFRRTVLTADGVHVFKLLRQKELKFAELTAVETVRVRQRAFLTINAGEEFLIIANMYAGFDRLLSSVLAQVPAAAISEETRTLAQAPPVKHSDIVTLWGLALMMAYLIFAQFPH